MKKTPIVFLSYILAALGYIACGIYLTRVSGLFIHSAIIWNLFLAVLPLLCSLIFTHTTHQHKIIHILSLIAWFLFFPNAPYMITDFIHITPLTFYEYASSGSIYLQNIITWMQLLYLALGIFVGVLSGFKSLAILHTYFKKHYSPLIIHILLAFVFLSSGYGIFLGRFLRLNSWDILHPFAMISEIISQTNSFAIAFSIMFAGFLALLYIAYLSLSQKKNPQCEDSSII